MGVGDNVQAIWNQKATLVWRPAQDFLVAAPGPNYDIFTIQGGAVHIMAIGAIETAAGVGATTLRVTINGVACDGGAIAINAGVNQVVFHPLNAGGNIVNAAAIPKTVATLTTVISGIQPAGADGVIVATFGTGTNWVGEFWIIYRRLCPSSNIIVA